MTAKRMERTMRAVRMALPGGAAEAAHYKRRAGRVKGRGVGFGGDGRMVVATGE